MIIKVKEIVGPSNFSAQFVKFSVNVESTINLYINMINLFYDWAKIVYINAMHTIEPLQDHLFLARIPIGEQIQFKGKPYKILQRTTLASGEPALVLQDNEKQFVVGASLLLTDVGKTEND